jgi:hypothetical protein
MNDELNQDDLQFLDETFGTFWTEMKHDIKEMSKKDLARHMFSAGFMLHQKFINDQMENFEKEMKDDPEKLSKIVEEIKENGKK